MPFDGVNGAHSPKPGHDRSGPVPECFFDKKDGGDQPHKGGEQQALEFLQGRAHVVSILL